MRLKPPNSEIIVGRFGAPHGVRGAIKLYAFGQSAKKIANYKPWLIKNEQGLWQELNITSCEAKPNFLLVTLKDTDSREKAQRFTNKEVAVYAHVLPKLPKGEYYWEELIGLNVENQAAVAFGEVTSLFATGANDVLVVKDDKGNERLIPFVVGEHVIEIDEENRLIKVEWDEDF